MKRKIKVWNKLKIYEASVVGIPSYPDAHASIDSFSLIKALSNASLKPRTGFVEEGEDVGDQLNLEEKTETMEEEKSQTEVEKEKVSTEVEKSFDMSETIVKAIKDGIKEGLKELETERGLVEKQTPVKKSLGELAIEQGLFVTK